MRIYILVLRGRRPVEDQWQLQLRARLAHAKEAKRKTEVTQVAYKIGEECIACGSCQPECPVEAISEGDIYVIDPEKCIECGSCADVCPVGAPKPE